MSLEYLFLTDKSLEFPLDESINVCLENDDNDYIIANKKVPNTQIFAHEIDIYARNTQDDIADRIQNIKKLYEARNIVYDQAQDMDYQAKVGKKILIITKEQKDDHRKQFDKDNFSILTFKPDEIVDINGHIGSLNVKTTKLVRGNLQVDQVLWYDAPEFALRQSGVYDPKKIGWDRAIDKIYNNIPIYRYKNYVIYNPDICQYSGRLLKETCGKCEEVCPTVSIIKVDEDKHLEFSDIDCHGCGGCVSVCPSGALDFSQMPRDAFAEAATLYRGHKVLIIPSNVDMPDLPFPEGVLPFGIEGRKFLSETHLLTLLQKSGNAVILYTDVVSRGTGDAVRIINDIFDRKYHKKAVYLCQNKEELEQALDEAEDISECMFDMADEGMNKREVFTYRLSHLVGEDDLGVVKTGEHIHYGNIKINEDTCTLCMACVGVCNVAAMTAHPEDQTLKFNPSLCTVCGYCEVACPEENCLNIVHDELSLNPSYFKKNTMARDELFACVECGKEFATRKSIEKISNMMAPRFGDDEAKIRALYCCPDCKPKVMMIAEYNKKTEKRS